METPLHLTTINTHQNDFLANEEIKISERMNKYTLKFFNKDIEKEYIKQKESGKGQRRLIFILLLVVFILICSRIITRMIIRIKEKSQTLLPVYNTVIIIESFSVITETILFFTSKLKILRGMFACTITYFGFCYLSYNVCQNSIDEPYFAPPVPILIVVIVCIYLVYMRNWICCLVCIIIDLAISLWYINSIIYQFWLENLLNNLIYIIGFTLLALSINYMEKFQRNSIFNKCIIQSEKENLKDMIEHLPLSVIVCREGEMKYVNNSFTSLCCKQDINESTDLSHDDRIDPNIVPNSSSINEAVFHIKNQQTEDKLVDYIKYQKEIREPEIFCFINFHSLKFMLEIISVKIIIKMKECLIYYIKDQTLITKLNISRERQDSMSLFLKSVSHDFRAPLNGILGSSGILLRDSTIISNSFLIKHTKNISCSSKLLLTLVEDILDYQTSKNSIIHLNITTFNFRNSFFEITDLIENGYKREGVNFIRNIHPFIPLTIRSDESRIHQVIMNLLSNAFKYTKRGGTVTVNANFDNLEGRIYLEVIDTGQGISEQNLKQLFKPFAKLYDRDGLNPKGIGLGLFNCKNLASRLGGEISVESKENVGSKFTFSFNAYLNIIEDHSIIPFEENKSQNSFEFHESKIDEMCDSIRIFSADIVF